VEQKDKPRILIVDDEKMNLKVLADLLKEDYSPILARDGEQALQHAFGDSPPDLILLDVVMPQMGGYEVIKRLKNNDKTNHIPVIFVTSLDSVLDEEHGLKLGAVDYITKPFSPPIVKIRVHNHLRIVHQYRLLDQLAYLDGLTEISNRRRFDEYFQRNGPGQREAAYLFPWPWSMSIILSSTTIIMDTPWGIVPCRKSPRPWTVFSSAPPISSPVTVARNLS